MIKNLLESRGRLPRLGVIRLGVKERDKHGKELPREVAFFVIPDALKSVIGEQPTKFSVLFPSDDPHRVLVTDYIRYSGRLLTRKCDGERFVEIPKDGGEITGTCEKTPGKPCPCKAKAMGRLNVIVLDASFGVYQIVIGGEQRIADLLTELEVFRRAFGRLTDIIFTVERIPTEVQVRREDGSRIPKVGWPVHVRCDFTAKDAIRLRGVAVPGLPVAALEEEEGEPVPVEPPHEEWDISMCYQAARQVGVKTDDYEAFLRAVYKVEPSDLPPEAITHEVQFWRKSQESEEARTLAYRTVEDVLARGKQRSEKELPF